MRRRDFLKIAGCGAAATALPGCADSLQESETAGPNQPNILWLISEDTSPDLGCYGRRLVDTPNLDKLAAEGVRLTNAFASAPVSSPARSAIMTGMYQTSIGAHNHRSHRDETYLLPRPAAVITEYFRRAGYYTCNSNGLTYKEAGKTDWNFTPRVEPFDGTDWSQRRPDQPFFAQMNFSLTHRDFRRDTRRPIDPDRVELPPYYPDHPIARRDWADYLESIQLLDTAIGVALAWLEKEALADNTIVVYFADHGRPHVRDKQWLYDGGVHIPMIVRWPGHIEPGTVMDDLVSAVDLAPTCLSLAGVRLPRHLQGYPFLGPRSRARKYVFAARDRCDETVDRIRCARSSRYKYIRNYYPEKPYLQPNAYKKLQYPTLTLMRVLHAQGRLTPEQASFMAPSRPREELYDLEQDPFELHNVAGDSAYRDVARRAASVLDDWLEAIGDTGATPEPPEVLAAQQRLADESFASTMAGRGLPVGIPDEEYLQWWQQKLLG